MLIYYGIFYKLDGKAWGVRFPDAHSTHTGGHDLNNCLEMALDALTLMLEVGRKGIEYEEPCSYEDIIVQAKKDELVFPIIIY